MGNEQSSVEYVTVYIWLPHGGHVGHASLKLPDGTYISWWPGEKNKNGKKRKSKAIGNWFGEPCYCSESLEEDIEEEGGARPIKHRVPVADADDIRRWWDEYKYNHTYSLTNNNCCDIVIKALRAGRFKGHVGNLIIPNNPVELAANLRQYRE